MNCSMCKKTLTGYAALVSSDFPFEMDPGVEVLETERGHALILHPTCFEDIINGVYTTEMRVSLKVMLGPIGDILAGLGVSDED